ncbi:unannotated protein [freshwater metagenome]|uniref:Unannotated protein n=1 Tax=freshwater metagenome TaxID=449393 RepID=A0A6J7EQ28_9ZZZZ|nr:hypothetical protein [Actinomycetota bacterium]
MTVSVTPATFSYVAFDAELIRSIAAGLLAALGMADHDVTIDVDETTPLARISCTIDESIHVHVDSGAFEDTRKPRQQSETATATALGRVLLRARDRLVGGFGEAPPDKELSLAQVAAWETYCIGRLQRFGVPVNQQRWRYNFRNRHGFSDATDAAFEQIWTSDGLTWDQLNAISESAAASAHA